jgi:hypothetical protein
LNNCTISTNSGGQGSHGGQPGWATVDSPGGWGGAGGSGAGIFNIGDLKLSFCVVNDNFAGNGGDGGSFGSGGNAGSGGNGAGILNLGTLILKTCTISGNYCGIGGNGGQGYGGNGAEGGDGGGGGGIYNASSLDLVSCTITLNGTGEGGNGGNGLSRSVGSTVAGGEGGYGGGVLNDASKAAVVVRNTLIARNSTSPGGLDGTNVAYPIFPPVPPSTILVTENGILNLNSPGPNLVGDFTSQGYNLIEMADGSTGFTNGVNADQVGSITSPIDPLIGPLQMNGGPTPTHALLPGSPAIDQGKSFGFHTDQRGYHRPYNYTSIPNVPGGDGSDIGAFEMGAH